MYKRSTQVAFFTAITEDTPQGQSHARGKTQQDCHQGSEFRRENVGNTARYTKSALFWKAGGKSKISLSETATQCP